MGQLAESFNLMTDRFQEIKNDLDRQVCERSRQLVRSERLAASFTGKTLISDRVVLGYGADLSHTQYDLTIAPGADERNIASIFGETDVQLNERWWLTTGARADHFKETIGTVFSPRVALRYKPDPRNAVRIAWGRAFRSPSVLEEFLSVPSIPVAMLDWAEVDQQLQILQLRHQA